MSKKYLFERALLARHGETQWNQAGKRQGQLDSPLTASGRNQASQLASIVENQHFDVICSSPLGRALETARVVARRANMEIVVVDELAELDHGTFAGLTNAEIKLRHPNARRERRQNKYAWRYPNGESYEDLDTRCASGLQRINTMGVSMPLIISHAMTTRMLLRNLLDLNPQDTMRLAIPHGAVLNVRPDSQTPFEWLHP